MALDPQDVDAAESIVNRITEKEDMGQIGAYEAGVKDALAWALDEADEEDLGWPFMDAEDEE